MPEKTPKTIYREEEKRRIMEMVFEKGKDATAATFKRGKRDVLKIWEEQKNKESTQSSSDEASNPEPEGSEEEKNKRKGRSQGQIESMNAARYKSPSTTKNRLTKTQTKARPQKRKPNRNTEDVEYKTEAKLPNSARVIMTRRALEDKPMNPSSDVENQADKQEAATQQSNNSDEDDSHHSKNSQEMVGRNMLPHEEQPLTNKDGSYNSDIIPPTRQSPQMEDDLLQNEEVISQKGTAPPTEMANEKPRKIQEENRTDIQPLLVNSPHGGIPYYSTPMALLPQRKHATDRRSTDQNTQQLISTVSSPGSSVYSIEEIAEYTEKDLANIRTSQLYETLKAHLEYLKPTDTGTKAILNNIWGIVEEIHGRHMYTIDVKNEAKANLKYVTEEILHKLDKPRKEVGVKSQQDKQHRITLMPTKSHTTKEIAKSLEQVGKENNLEAQQVKSYSDVIKIRCRNEEEVKRLSAALEKDNKIKTTTTLRHPSESKRKIIVHNVPTYVTEEQLKNYITQEATFNNTQSIARIRTFRSRFQNKQHWALSMEAQAATQLINLRSICINLSTCNIRPFVTATRCNWCQAIGHAERFCRSKHPTCEKCTGQHLKNDCQHKGSPMCINCSSENAKGHSLDVHHEASSNKCQVWRYHTKQLARQTQN